MLCARTPPPPRGAPLSPAWPHNPGLIPDATGDYLLSRWDHIRKGTLPDVPKANTKNKRGSEKEENQEHTVALHLPAGRGRQIKKPVYNVQSIMLSMPTTEEKKKKEEKRGQITDYFSGCCFATASPWQHVMYTPTLVMCQKLPSWSMHFYINAHGPRWPYMNTLLTVWASGVTAATWPQRDQTTSIISWKWRARQNGPGDAQTSTEMQTS